jgi:guanylate kinase
MNQKGILTVVSGFSGAGKGTLMKGLLSRYANYSLSISATTRKPRISAATGEKETDGVEYFFRSKEEFERMIDNDELIEYARYQEHYYGTPRKYVEEQLNSGKDVILEIEVQGAAKVKALLPDTVLIFVTPPSAKELARRLRMRGTESEEEIRGRLRRAAEEAGFIPAYDYLLVNDDLEDAITKLHGIIQSEHISSSRNEAFISEIMKELKESMKGDDLA